MSQQAPREFERLVSLLLDQELSEAQQARLAEMLRSSAELRRAYARLTQYHALLRAEHAPLPDGLPELPASPMIAPPTIAPPTIAPSSVAPSLPLSWLGSTVRLVNRPAVFSVIFATSFVVFGLTVLALWQSGSSPVAAPQVAKTETAPRFVGELTATHAAQWAAEDSPLSAGTHLRRGQELRLAGGVAELTFPRGTRVLLQGPATFRMLSDEAVQLTRGKLVARVPANAVGFVVATPRGTIRDLGTEFAVLVHQAATEIEVFQGAVLLQRSDAGDATAPGAIESGTKLTAGQMARWSNSGDPPAVRNEINPARFVRTYPAQRTLPLVSTGLKLKLGAPDPHWQVSAASKLVNLKPTAAIAMPEVPVNYAPNYTANAQWITVPGDTHVPANGVYTFHYRFPMEGFDLSSARIKGWFQVDNWVTAIRVNGQPLKVLPKQKPTGRNYLLPIHFRLSHGLVEGENTIEFDVMNGDQYDASQMALRVEWSGWAVENLPASAMETFAPAAF